jgi:hypothetical protein
MEENQMPPGKRWSNKARQKTSKKKDIMERVNKSEENKDANV